MQQHYKTFDPNINAAYTHVTALSDDQPINVGSKKTNQSGCFKCIGSLINIERNSIADVRALTRGVIIVLTYGSQRISGCVRIYS